MLKNTLIVFYYEVILTVFIWKVFRTFVLLRSFSYLCMLICYIKNIYFENTPLPKEFTQNNGSSADHLFFSDRRIYNIYINNIHCKYSYSLMEYDLRTIISSNQTIFEAKLEASEKKNQRLESKLSKIFEFLELADDCLDIEDQDKDIKIKGLMKEVARLKKNSKK